MRGISREVLARDATARIDQAACATQAGRWSSLEAAHDRACTSVASREVVEHVWREFCDGCPAMAACASWAQAEEYSGLAAGAAYDEGERQAPAWVSRRPGRPSKVAS